MKRREYYSYVNKASFYYSMYNSRYWNLIFREQRVQIKKYRCVLFFHSKQPNDVSFIKTHLYLSHIAGERKKKYDKGGPSSIMMINSLH